MNLLLWFMVKYHPSDDTFVLTACDSSIFDLVWEIPQQSNPITWSKARPISTTNLYTSNVSLLHKLHGSTFLFRQWSEFNWQNIWGVGGEGGRQKWGSSYLRTERVWLRDWLPNGRFQETEKKASLRHGVWLNNFYPFQSFLRHSLYV